MEYCKLKKEHLEFFESECEKWMKKFGSDLEGRVKQTAIHECLGLLLATAVLKETRTWKETGIWDESDFKKKLHSITRVLEKSLGKGKNKESSETEEKEKKIIKKFSQKR